MGILDNTRATPNLGLAGKTLLLAGNPKTGKSTLANSRDGNIFADFEGGLQFLDCDRVPCSTWQDVLALRDELLKGNHKFKNVTVDTTDLFIKACEKYVVARAKVKDINDGELSYGKGAAQVKEEINNFLIPLKQKGITVILITHSKEREMKTKTSSWTYMGTTLPPAMETTITALCDYIFYCYQSDDGKRVMRTKPHKYVLAGDRSGKLPDIMPMDLNLIEKTLIQQPSTQQEGK